MESVYERYGEAAVRKTKAQTSLEYSEIEIKGLLMLMLNEGDEQSWGETTNPIPLRECSRASISFTVMDESVTEDLDVENMAAYMQIWYRD